MSQDIPVPEKKRVETLHPGTPLSSSTSGVEKNLIRIDPAEKKSLREEPNFE